MRHLVAMNVVGENGEDTYYSNPLAEAFAEAGYRDGIIFKLVKPETTQIPEMSPSLYFQLSHRFSF